MSAEPLYCERCQGSPIMLATGTVVIDVELAEGYARRGSLQTRTHVCDDCRASIFGDDGARFMVGRRAVIATLSLRRLQRKRR